MVDHAEAGRPSSYNGGRCVQDETLVCKRERVVASIAPLLADTAQHVGDGGEIDEGEDGGEKRREKGLYGERNAVNACGLHFKLVSATPFSKSCCRLEGNPSDFAG